MAGWDLKSGSIKEEFVSEDRIWALFNYVFFDSSRKRNTYKFGLIKAIIDNAFNEKTRLKESSIPMKKYLNILQRTTGILFQNVI